MGPASSRPDTRTPPLSGPRARVLDALHASPAPSTVATLSEQLGIHTNTVREHLEALVTRRLATKQLRPPVGRGRPAWSYSAAGSADLDPRVRDYAALATALAGQIARTSPDPHADALAAGESWGRELSAGFPPRGPAEARRSVVELLADLGFEPAANARATTIRLRCCPLLEAARARPDIVCPVHLGLVRGVLSELGGEAEGATLTPFSEPGACRLDLPAAADPPSRGPSRPPPAPATHLGASRP